jgi:hypothetical protein
MPWILDGLWGPEPANHPRSFKGGKSRVRRRRATVWRIRRAILRRSRLISAPVTPRPIRSLGWVVARRQTRRAGVGSDRRPPRRSRNPRPNPLALVRRAASPSCPPSPVYTPYSLIETPGGSPTFHRVAVSLPTGRRPPGARGAHDGANRPKPGRGTRRDRPLRITCRSWRRLTYGVYWNDTSNFSMRPCGPGTTERSWRHFPTGR